MQTPTQFPARKLQRSGGFADLVLRHVLCTVLDVDHISKRHDRNVELVRIFLQELLRLIRTVKRLAIAVRSGARMVTANDEVRATVVFSNERMPERFTRAGHAHCERQKAQRRRLLRVVLEKLLVAAYAREMIDIARLCHAYDRVNKEIGFSVLRRAERELEMRSMHGVSGLKCNHTPPSELLELVANFLRGVAQMFEVVVSRRLNTLETPTDIDVVGAIVQVVDGRVSFIVLAHHRGSLSMLIRRENTGDFHRRNEHAFCITQRDLISFGQRFGENLRHVERDRHRPNDTVRQTHGRQHTRVVVGTEEPLQRRKRAVEQKL